MPYQPNRYGAGYNPPLKEPTVPIGSNPPLRTYNQPF